MDFKLTQEQTLLQKLAADFTKEHISPNANDWDEQKYFPKDVLKSLAELGMAAMVSSESIGGSGLSRLDAAIVFEQLAIGCPSTAAYLSIHNMVVSLIDAYADEHIKVQYGKPLASMELLGSYCLTEPESGSDAAALKTKAVKQGGDYIINGSKAFISGGGVSDVYLCMVRTEDEADHHGISCILIEKDTKGISFGHPEKKIGWLSQPTAMVFFEDCRVPQTNLIGQAGMGFKIALNALNGGRINIAACSVGGAKGCIDHSMVYMKERKQFGKTLNEFQALRFKLAEMFIRYQAAQLMTYQAATYLDSDDKNAPLQAAMAKKHATEAAFYISHEALQLHGGYGCLKDYAIERYFRDLRIHQVVEGTNEIMNEIIAKTILEQV